LTWCTAINNAPDTGDCPFHRLSWSVDSGLLGQSPGLTAGVPFAWPGAHDRSVGRAPRVPVELTNRPFDLEDARRHGLTKHHLAGATWRRIGPGFYAWRDIADSPMVVLLAAQRRLVDSAVFSGRTAAWLHGLDMAPCDPVEVTLRPDSPNRSRCRNFHPPSRITRS